MATCCCRAVLLDIWMLSSVFLGSILRLYSTLQQWPNNMWFLEYTQLQIPFQRNTFWRMLKKKLHTACCVIISQDYQVPKFYQLLIMFTHLSENQQTSISHWTSISHHTAERIWSFSSFSPVCLKVFGYCPVDPIHLWEQWHLNHHVPSRSFTLPFHVHSVAYTSM